MIDILTKNEYVALQGIHPDDDAAFLRAATAARDLMEYLTFCRCRENLTEAKRAMAAQITWSMRRSDTARRTKKEQIGDWSVEYEEEQRVSPEALTVLVNAGLRSPYPEVFECRR